MSGGSPGRLYAQKTEGYEVLFSESANESSEPVFDASEAEAAAEDRAWASGRDADFAADREWGRRGFLS